MKRTIKSITIALCMAAVCLLPAAASPGLAFTYDPTAPAQEQPDAVDPSGTPAAGPSDPSAAEDPSEPATMEPTAPVTTKPTQTTTKKPTQPTTKKPTTTKATTTTAAPRKDPTPVLSSVKAGYRSIRLGWFPVKNAVGYEIYLKQENKEKTIIKAGIENTSTLTKLNCGKKYTVKVRSVKKKDGKKIRSEWSESKTVTVSHTDWEMLKKKYQNKGDVNELIFVRYKGGTKADLLLYEKNAKGKWKLVLCCPAYVGKKGIDKKKEGDGKTPKGQFPITCAFGIKADPGSKMQYTKINKHHYWCADKRYNQMVDLREKPHSCSGEHLIDHTKQYAYAMNIGYNNSGEKGKGFAIFLHCFGYYKYTLGCVAVSKTNMIKILQTCGDGTMICIYRK